MKFLDPKIFRPDMLDENYDDERNLMEIEAAREKYNSFLNQCKKKIDRRLLKLYEKTDCFHDYTLKKLNLIPCNSYSKSKFHSIELEVMDEEIGDIHFYLEDIGYYNMNLNQLGWTKLEKNFFPGEIALCEIGYEDGYSFINFVLNDAEVSIYFKKAIYKIDKFEV